MRNQNRRKHFLVHKPFQFHYLIYTVILLIVVSGAALIGSHYGIWGLAIDAFSTASVKNKLTTAQQIYEYDQARRPIPSTSSKTSLRTYGATELLSAREREIINEIMNETDQKIALLGLILIIFIGWGSIYVTHKVAGPVFKIKQYMAHVAERDLTVRIHFRKHDELQDLAPLFNAMMSSLDDSYGRVKKMSEESPSEKLREEIQKELSQFKLTER
jgi:methyl-accepting chemotaxis protein